MAQQQDRILEGVSARELASLQALDGGGAQPTAGDIHPLQAKGWVEVVGKEAIITLTGRALLDGRATGLR